MTVVTDLERSVPDRVIQLFALHDATMNFFSHPSKPSSTLVTSATTFINYYAGPFWERLTLPFSFEVDDDILIGPNFIPEMPRDLEPLPTVPKEEWEEDYIEESIWFDRKKELYLKKLVKKVQSVARVTAAVTEWNFIEIAMGYLGRAFLTEEGLDQILWHVAVLDALFSEENAGVRRAIRPRIGTILGASEAEKKDVQKRFDELYAFRSELVHGKK